MSSNKLTKVFLFLLLSSVILSTGTIDYLKYDLDSAPKDLIWCGHSSENAIVLTELNSVYRSDDRGLHWKKLNDIFTNTGKDELDDNENEIGKVATILQSPADKTLLVFLGTQGINWVGEDCGRKITALNHGRRINEFIFHPTERGWGLASAYTLCEDFVGEPCKIYKEVYLTKDLGINWTQLGSYVVQFGWGVVEKKQIDKGVPKERILMTYEPRGKGDQTQTGWNYKVDFVYSDDFFKTTKVLASKGNKFLLTNHYLFVAQVVDQDTQEVLLLGTKSTHYDYDLQPIETNQKSFLEHSYTFLDTTLHSVFLHMNHFGDVSQYGHVYTSGPRGLKYNLSLRNNVRSSDNQCDFEKVNSVEGVYVANVISGKYIKLAKKEMEQYTMDVKERMGKEVATHQNKGSHAKKNLSYKDYIKTLITFNRGGDWKRLVAPERDSEGKRYDCGNYCFLNLFGLSSDFPPFYSVDTAAGIIIGNGNVGHYLSSEVATFMSRDGGLSWFEVRKGSHIYEIGDQGGLILIAEDQHPTNKILYTYDEGLTWEEVQISEEKFTIKNIIIEPSSKSHYFIVYGETFKGGVKKGVVVGINFGNAFPQCRNPNSPDSANSDYEKWSPSDGRAGRECLLGHKITIVRKKRESRCINDETFQRKIVVQNCECTEDDYQCDMGFERVEPGQPCTRIAGTTEEIVHSAPAVCNKVYHISRGYRRIPGDTCINGVKYDPITLPCPNQGMLGSFGIVLFIAILVVFGVLIYFAMNSECSFDLKGMLSTFMTKNEPYQRVDLSDEDNMLFEDDSKILNPIQTKKKEEPKV